MHMLHTRRKAEIEILSTAKPIQQPRYLHGDIDGISRQTSPLLDYLLDKISDFVHVYS